MKGCAFFSVMLVMVIGFGGCVSLDEYKRVSQENANRLARIQDLELAQERQLLRVDECQSSYDALSIQCDGCDEKLAAVEAALAMRMQDLAMLSSDMGQIALPVELSDALSEWALQGGSDLVSYDPQSGIVRFKSDLLFEKGSDTVQAAAKSQVQMLASILDSSSAEGFDVLVVGHTDSAPIQLASTRAKHPTNWHLSAHRAIAVEIILAEAGVDQNRTAVVGMGEFRPIAPNSTKSGSMGNPKNRRVEIYIVPANAIMMKRTTQP